MMGRVVNRRFLAVLVVVMFILVQSSSSQTADEKSEECGQDIKTRDSLIDEANRDQFNTRRVEIAGSTYTRHREFSRRMAPGLNEGDIFTRGALEKSIRQVSKMKAIYPISIENVEVR